MRKQALRAVAMLSLLLSLAVVSTRAQSTDIVSVTIPFDFQVSDKTFPAGEYLVRRNSQNNDVAWQILQQDGSASAFFLTSAIQTGTVKENSALVFNRYEDQYFLSRVWTAGASEGRELRKSRQERALGREVARNRSERLIVTVVSRRR